MSHIHSTDNGHSAVDSATAGKAQFTKGYSLEITAKDCDGLKAANHLIAAKTSVSITFLPGETMSSRIRAATEVRSLGFEPLPHLSARRIATGQELDDFLRDMVREAAVQQVFVVAGDPDQQCGPYRDSLDLIRSGLLEKHGIRKVGIAGYPEGHPQIPAELLEKAMQDKLALLSRAGFDADITTQFSFDPEAVVNWVKRVRSNGVEAPLRIGIPGPASMKTLLRFASRCGVGASTKVMARYGLSIGKLLTTTGPDRLVAELRRGLASAPCGDVSMHFYPFGGVATTAKWIHDFSQNQSR